MQKAFFTIFLFFLLPTCMQVDGKQLDENTIASFQKRSTAKQRIVKNNHQSQFRSYIIYIVGNISIGGIVALLLSRAGMQRKSVKIPLQEPLLKQKNPEKNQYLSENQKGIYASMVDKSCKEEVKQESNEKLVEAKAVTKKEQLEKAGKARKLAKKSLAMSRVRERINQLQLEESFDFESNEVQIIGGKPLICKGYFSIGQNSPPRIGKWGDQDVVVKVVGKEELETHLLVNQLDENIGPKVLTCFKIKKIERFFNIREHVLVMEYLPEDPLLEANWHVRIRNLFHALSVMHAADLIHGDLMIPNIKGDKLIDFDLGCTDGYTWWKDRTAIHTKKAETQKLAITLLVMKHVKNDWFRSSIGAFGNYYPAVKAIKEAEESGKYVLDQYDKFLIKIIDQPAGWEKEDYKDAYSAEEVVKLFDQLFDKK